MPVFGASLDTLWTELPAMARPAAAARAGFEWVEIPSPYDINAADLRRELIRRGLRLASIACPPPNYTGGPQGFAAVPGTEGRFRRDLSRALRYAGLLRPRVVQIVAGEAEGPEARATLVANLGWAAEKAGRVRLTIEPASAQGRDGVLCCFDRAAGVLDEVAAPNLGLQFDAAHAQAITGDALAAWTRHRARVGHVQFADAPGRGPPGSGALDLEAFFAALDAAGYDGPVCAEYDPGGSTGATLGWLRAHAGS